MQVHSADQLFGMHLHTLSFNTAGMHMHAARRVPQVFQRVLYAYAFWLRKQMHAYAYLKVPVLVT